MGANKTVNAQIQWITSYIINRLKKENVLRIIKSIILTGSLTTGEIASLIKNKTCVIYSDFDLIIVLSKLNHLLYRKKLRHLSSQITAELKEKGILKSHVCLVPMTPRFIANMRPTINNYSIKKTAKTIYGKDYLHLIPSFEAKDIIKEDALEMIGNRMAEQLIYKNTEYCGYQSVKAMLDCAGARLVMQNKYTIKYKDKCKNKKLYKYKLHPDFSKKDIPWLWAEANQELIRTWDIILAQLFGDEKQYIKEHSFWNFLLFLIHRPYLEFIRYRVHPKIRVNLAVYYYLRYLENNELMSLRKVKSNIFIFSNTNLERMLIHQWTLCSSTGIRVF